MATITEYAEIYETWDSSTSRWTSSGWVPGSEGQFKAWEGRFGMRWINELARSEWRVVARAASQSADSGPGYGFERSNNVRRLTRTREAEV